MGQYYDKLTAQEIKDIVWAIKNWPLDEKLEWERLRERLPLRLPERKTIPTRLTLFRQIDIRNAFTERKKELREKGGKYGDKPIELQQALKKNDKLEDENKRLQKQIEELQEQINREAYNTYLGRDKAAPIRKIDRGASK
jgi:hypothetical protein